MNISEMKISSINAIDIKDSLRAPLLKINIKLNDSTIIPQNNDLIIYVDRNSLGTLEKKEYHFSLSDSLKRIQGITDEFILEPMFDGTNIEAKAYVKRLINEDSILETEEIEMVQFEPIILFEGANYITTNYENATIEAIYPKNNEMVNCFLNTILYSIREKKKVLTLDDIYFKNCFTEVEDGINSYFNKTTMKCFNSPNNAFSMDCEGNLIVNSIISRVGNKQNISFDDIYPVGSVYLSVSNTDPSNLFGGTWERITGYYLYTGDENTTGGSTNSGAASGNTGATKLTVSQIPSHRHSIPSLSGSTGGGGNHRHTLDGNNDTVASGKTYMRPRTSGQTGTIGYYTDYSGNHTHNVTTNGSNTGYEGGNGGHEHSLNNHTHTINPPFYSLFVYKRIA